MVEIHEDDNTALPSVLAMETVDSWSASLDQPNVVVP